WELTDEDWNQVIACDLTSVFLVSRAAVKLMLPQRSGRIVNLASIAGEEGADAGNSRQRGRAGRDRDRHGEADVEGDRGLLDRQDSDGAGRSSRRGGGAGRLARVGRGALPDRAG